MTVGSRGLTWPTVLAIMTMWMEATEAGEMGVEKGRDGKEEER